MKTLNKILVIVATLTISVSVFAQMGGGREGSGHMQSMMNADSPKYQMMLELRKDPEAIQARMQSMRDDPEAMSEWMKQVHGEDFANWKGGFGCHGNRFNNEQTSASK